MTTSINQRRGRDRQTFTLETSGSEAYMRARKALRGVHMEEGKVVRVRIEINTIDNRDETTQLTIDDVCKQNTPGDESEDKHILSQLREDFDKLNDNGDEEDMSIGSEAEDGDPNKIEQILIDGHRLIPGDEIRVKTSENGWYTSTQEVIRIEQVDIQRNQINEKRITHRVYLTKASPTATERPWIEQDDEGKFHYRTSSHSQPIPLENIEMVNASRNLDG